MAGKIPKGWDRTPNISTTIETGSTFDEGLRFLIFKTPIRNTSWRTKDVLTSRPQFEEFKSLIINMKPNAEAKLRYNPESFERKGIVYNEMYPYGNGKPPPDFVVDEFFRLVDDFVRENPDCVVGVHGTKGVDRPGYFVAMYLIQRLGWHPDIAIDTVDTARGIPITEQCLLSKLRTQKSNIHSNEKAMVGEIPKAWVAKPNISTTIERDPTGTMAGMIPKGWDLTPNMSTTIKTGPTSDKGLQFFIFKTPIRNTSWTTRDVLTICPELRKFDSLIINMKPNQEATVRYNPDDFQRHGIMYQEM